MRKIWWVVIGIAVVMAAYVMMLLQPPPEPEIDWRETFDPNSRHPYGTQVLYRLLQNHYPQTTFVHVSDPLIEVLPYLDTSVHHTLLYIGNNFWVADSTAENLVTFMELGNTVMLLTEDIGNPFYEQLPIYYCQPDHWLDYFRDDTIVPYWVDNLHADSVPEPAAAPFPHRTGTITHFTNWTYSTMENTGCDSAQLYTALGYAESPQLINYLKVPVGKGQLLLHTQPLLFTNIALLDSTYLRYAERVFQEMPPGKILWDASVPPDLSENAAYLTQSPLSFILSQRALRWAWYVLLATLLLFILFRGKRQQAIVPVIQAPVNHSMRFIETIGLLHFQRQDHHKTASKLFQYWLLQCRQWYHEAPQYDTPESMERLAKKSTVPLKTIREICYLGERLEKKKNYYTRQELLHFHQLIQQFYANKA